MNLIGQYPWTPKSTWDPPRYLNEKLEEYLDEVYSDFCPQTVLEKYLIT